MGEDAPIQLTIRSGAGEHEHWMHPDARLRAAFPAIIKTHKEMGLTEPPDQFVSYLLLDHYGEELDEQTPVGELGVVSGDILTLLMKPREEPQ